MKIVNVPYILRLKIESLRLRFHPSGQMSIQNDVGRLLFAICGLSDNENIVEIGTWNGLGSSAIIAQGVTSGKSKARVIGLEILRERVEESKKNLKKFEFFTVLHGRILEIEDLDSNLLEDIEKNWFISDSLNISSAPNVLELLPQRIDVLLLDGGEFSSYCEYLNLKDRVVRWLILDDVNVRKNRRVLQEAVSSGEFSLVWKSDERNGAAVLIRKDLVQN